MTETQEKPTTKYYKVLVDGRSCHGGNLKWSMPNGHPGDWHEVKESLSMCNVGLHVTREPARWWVDKAQVFEVEIDGKKLEDGSDKICVQRCRLMRQVAAENLSEIRIFTEGYHEVRDALAIACGSSEVTAYGSSKVTAYDSSEVTAYHSSEVTAYGSSEVMAYHSSKVTAYDSSEVTAYDSSEVTAYHSSKVTACGSSTTNTVSGKTVNVKDNAVSIDRRNGKPVVTVASGKLVEEKP